MLATRLNRHNKMDKNNDQDFELLVKKHLLSVYNFVARFTGDLAEANDITQEAFLKAWKNFKKFDQTKNFKTWIFTIARNTSLDWLRKRRPTAFSALQKFSNENDEAFDVSDESLVSAEEIFDIKKDSERLSGILKKLSPLQQTVIMLKVNENLTFQSMSEILGEPLNTVKSRYRRALASLKAKMMDAPNKLK